MHEPGLCPYACDIPRESPLRWIQTQYTVLFTCDIYLYMRLFFFFCHVVPWEVWTQKGKDHFGVCSLSPVLELMCGTGPWVPKCLPTVDRPNHGVFWNPWHYEVPCQARTWVLWYHRPTMAGLVVLPVTNRMLFRVHRCYGLKSWVQANLIP